MVCFTRGCLAMAVAAACALTIGANDPLCPPGEPRCLPTDKADIFIVNGREHKLSYAEPFRFEASCKAASLDDSAWPRFPRPQRFGSVTLRGCAPPSNRSYTEALRALRIIATQEMYLLDIPADSYLSTAALEDLSPVITEFSLSAKGGILRSEPGALADLEVVNLGLSNVNFDQLPGYLTNLNVENSGIMELPPEALNTYQLTIHEPNLTSITGSAPKLERLWLHAPVRTLPNAPKLNRLTLTDISPGPLPSGYVEGMPKLATIDLKNVVIEPLPPGFLRGAAKLEEFRAVGCGLVSLPEDLFAYTKHLRLIDLTDNKIESLPGDLFTGLNSMNLLWMKNNRLKMADVHAIAPLTSLSALRLSQNPLGDLCDPGNSSMLLHMQKLDTLELEETQATRVCADYLRNLGSLSRLNLSNNFITGFLCSELLVPYAPYHFASEVILEDNPFERIDCSQEDYLHVGGIPKDVPKGFISTNSRMKCDCAGYWLSRMLRERRVEIAFDPEFEKDSCAEDWVACRPKDEEKQHRVSLDECGELSPKQVGLSIGGRTAEHGELPWHTAVYQNASENSSGYKHICGGSLVSKKIVISAAHCFWHHHHHQLPASEFAVALGKIYRRWNDPRDRDVQKSLLSDLKLHKRFLGTTNNYQSDIALMILRETILYQPHIAPICLDFGYLFENQQLTDGNKAKVAGWGLVSEDGAQTELLKVVELPYRTVETCQASAPPAFKQFITIDKICAGYTNGQAALCRGDSGGGLAFPVMYREKLRFYLRGVVSTAPSSDNKACNKYWMTTFTQLSKHAYFVFQVSDA